MLGMNAHTGQPLAGLVQQDPEDDVEFAQTLRIELAADLLAHEPLIAAVELDPAPGGLVDQQW